MAPSALDRARQAIAAAKSAVHALGPVARVDGHLVAGDTPLAGHDILVDAVRDTHGFGCTIFDRNVRIATTATAAGSVRRAVGTEANATITHQVHRLGRPFAGITRTIGKDWVIVYEPLRDGGGGIVGMVACYDDLLHLLDDLAVLDDADMGVMLLDDDGRLLDLNRVAADMLGYRPALREPVSLGLDPVELRLDGTPVTHEVVWTRADGHRYPVEVTQRQLPDGRQLVLARDFTEPARARSALDAVNARLEAEVAARTAELRQTLAQRAAMVDNLTDGMVAVTADGTLAVVNPALRGLLGFHDVDLRDLTLAALHPDLPAGVDLCRGDRTSVSVELRLPGGRTGGAVVSPIVRDGLWEGAVVVVRDITLAKEVDRMKTDFIATVSHELRTPLTSMMGFAKLAHRKVVDKIAPVVPDDRRVQRAVRQVDNNLAIIVQEGKRLARLIDDVLDISKMEAGEIDWSEEEIELRELVDESLAVTAGLFTEDDVVIRSQVEPGLAPFVGDRARLLQVLINLISNARKFTERGHVLVAVESTDAGLRIAVSDTGCGIAEPDREAVFTKFKQAANTLTDKPHGTGLGLPICTHIVERHGGTLGVDSRLGHGSTFWCLLPDRDAEPTPTTARRVRRPPPLGTRTADIVVVDDDPSLRELLVQILSEAGHHVRPAANGLEGVHAVRARRPDLLLLDIRMPDISGFDVAAVIRADPTTADLPILVLSVALDHGRADAAGVDRTLLKPIDHSRLLEAIDDLLRGGVPEST